jgi:photosystem II stability/assembly factor-like uncharacterized protein
LSLSVLAIDPNNPRTIYAGTGTHDNYDGGEGLYRSQDGGQTWSLLKNWAEVGEGSYIEGIALDHNNSQIIYVAGSKGVFRSSDGGNTWTKISGDSQ